MVSEKAQCPDEAAENRRGIYGFMSVNDEAGTSLNHWIGFLGKIKTGNHGFYHLI